MLTVLAVAGVVFRWHWLVALGLASIVLDETDRCTDDRRHGQLDHPDADRHPSLVFYLEALDYEFKLSDRDDIRQTHVVLIGAFLALDLAQWRE